MKKSILCTKSKEEVKDDVDDGGSCNTVSSRGSSTAYCDEMKKRIVPQQNPLKEIENLKKSYSFYTDIPVVCIDGDQEILIKIPMLDAKVMELV